MEWIDSARRARACAAALSRFVVTAGLAAATAAGLGCDGRLERLDPAGAGPAESPEGSYAAVRWQNGGKEWPGRGRLPPGHFADAGADPEPDSADGGGTMDAGDVSDAGASPTAPAPSGSLALRVEAVSSHSVTVAWDAIGDAEGYDVYVQAEPSSTRLPDAVLVGSVPPAETRFDLTSLAAATDVFVRVEARTTGDSVWGSAHARTAGGQAAALASPLRSVHGYGTDVLLLVLSDPNLRYDGSALTGDHGASWQGGTWTVERHDGTPIGVRTVHRDTVPVGQPSYPVGYWRWPDDSIVDVDHHIFLVLDGAIGARDVLRVRHSGSDTPLDVLVPFSDRYLETPLVQVNQVGYNPRATRRWAYVSGWMGSGGRCDPSTLPATADVLIEALDPLGLRRTAVAGLPLTSRSTDDVESGSEVRQIDLASVPPAEGVRYRVRVPGVGVSWPTAVSEEAALRAFYLVARGLYHNRWCGDLDPSRTEWSRPEDHCSAYFVTGTRYSAGMFAESTPQTNPRPLRGGHHDAGDFDIRPFHVVAGQYLLRAFELHPDRYADGQLDVPESGNGIPDLLDEALWSLAAWQQLQNTDGSVRAGVESYRHPAGIHKAHDDELPYWTFDPEPWHTAYVAALFAQAARLVRPYDTTKSAELERAARAAWSSSITSSAPAGFRLYAASELTALTGESTFASAFASIWRSLDRYGHGAFDSFVTMEQVYPGFFHSGSAMADYVMGYAGSSAADPAIVGVIHSEIRRRADAVAAELLESPHAHRNGRSPAAAPDWGATSSTGRHGDLLYQALSLPGVPADARQRYFDALSVAADYALGCNPLGQSVLTGLGSRTPVQPLHLDSLAFIKEGMPPVPGIPVYGPVRSLPSASYYGPVKAGFFPTFDLRPLGRRVADTRTAVTTSEFTVWENQAPFSELFGALLGSGGLLPPPSWGVGGAQHRTSVLPATAE